MKIDLIRKGKVAQALSNALARRHNIRFGVSTPTEAMYGSLSDVARLAEIVILTTPWSAETKVAAEIADDVIDKPVIDASNPVAMSDVCPTVSPAARPSAAEGLQAKLPRAQVVRTFNQIGAEFVADRGALNARPVMAATADNASARQAALGLIEDAGFED